MPLQTGQVLNNRYRMVKLLGQGGFGAVYRAWDVTFQLPCAVKENTEISPEGQRQFLREAQILHTLRHPNLPLVKDYFIIPGQGQYLVMDYVEGDDLEAILARAGNPLPEDQVLGWLVEVCDALEYMHASSPPVIHRDIKPANIKISSMGKVLLVDFGISKVYDPNVPTTKGAQAVSPGYSPFEQYGHATTDPRTDIYSLGATAYTLLTGQVPIESITRMTGVELQSPNSLNPEISRMTDQALMRAMAIMPDDRYQSAGELRGALREAISTRVQPASTPAQVAPVSQTEVVETHAPTSVASTPDVVGVSKPPSPAARIEAKFSPPGTTPSGERRRSSWLRILGLALVGLVVIAGAFYFFTYDPLNLIYPPTPTRVEPTEPEPVEPEPVELEEPAPAELGEPEEPPPPEPAFEIGGLWVGGLEEAGGEHLFMDFVLEIAPDPDSNLFEGEEEIHTPDGVVRMRIEGFVEGYYFEFHDEENRHFRGEFEEEGRRLGGEVFWDCFECELWAFFNVGRE